MYEIVEKNIDLTADEIDIMKLALDHSLYWRNLYGRMSVGKIRELKNNSHI